MNNWFDFSLAFSLIPELAKGAWIAIFVTSVSWILSLFLGLPLLLLRRTSIAPVSRLTAFFIEFIRSTPLLVQIFFYFYVLPLAGITLPPVATAIVAMSIHYGCYMSEVYRAGVDSVPKGQWDAAKALDFSTVDTYRHLIVPQIVPILIPSAGNYFVFMIKDTPFLATIGVAEVMFRANAFGTSNYRYLEPVTVGGLIFLVLSITAALIFRYLERATGRKWAVERGLNRGNTGNV